MGLFPAWRSVGEGFVAEPRSTRATQWYRRAIEYLPCYVKARVHLAEIYLSCGQTDEAEALLVPVLSSGDPEVHWRLADVMNASGRTADVNALMRSARAASTFCWENTYWHLRTTERNFIPGLATTSDGPLNLRGSTSQIVQLCARWN